MISNPSNRLSGIIDDATASPASTEAQREASRRNGAKSRGPVSDEGKARSRLNSVKHGLLAKVITPPGDPRQHDLLYRRYRQELIDELKPSSFSERALVDALASDYVQLGRARAMIEAAQRMPSMNKQDQATWELIQHRRREERHLDDAVVRIDAGQPPATTMKTARFLLDMLKALVDQFVGDAEDEEVDDDDYVDPATAQLNKLIGPLEKFLNRDEHTAARLRGQQVCSEPEMACLRPVLVFLRDAARRWIRDHDDVQRRLDRQHEDSLTAWATTPEKLMLLARYVRTLERDIERKLERLR